jgi:hypothetical protein
MGVRGMIDIEKRENDQINRQQLIFELTRYELEWFTQNTDKHIIEELSDFFSNGGFYSLEDTDLKKMYDHKFGDEDS